VGGPKKNAKIKPFKKHFQKGVSKKKRGGIKKINKREKLHVLAVYGTRFDAQIWGPGLLLKFGGGWGQKGGGGAFGV